MKKGRKPEYPENPPGEMMRICCAIVPGLLGVPAMFKLYRRDNLLGLVGPVSVY